MVDDHIDRLCCSPGSDIGASNWSGAWQDGKMELYQHFAQAWDDIFNNPELGLLSKFLMSCELPFTVARKITIPIPCDGYYCRALIALSVVLSPYWLAYYFWSSHDLNFFAKEWVVNFSIFSLVALLVGASVLRYAPGGEGRMAMVSWHVFGNGSMLFHRVCSHKSTLVSVCCDPYCVVRICHCRYLG